MKQFGLEFEAVKNAVIAGILIRVLRLDNPYKSIEEIEIFDSK